MYLLQHSVKEFKILLHFFFLLGATHVFSSGCSANLLVRFGVLIVMLSLKSIQASTSCTIVLLCVVSVGKEC